MKFSIVVPIFNEGEIIKELVEEIYLSLNELDFEVLLIDDGSKDNTIEIVRSLKSKYKSLRLISHEKNIGQSAAIRTGVKFSKFPVIVTLDGDGQNDPKDIPKLINIFRSAFKENNAVVIAGYRKKRKDSFIKIFSSRLANIIRSKFLNDKTPDTGCGLKVFSRDAFLTLPFFNHYHRYIPALFLSINGDVISVEVNHRPREKGVSKYGFNNRLWVGVIDLIGVKWLTKRSKLANTKELQ